jgi:hypothetical protein
VFELVSGANTFDAWKSCPVHCVPARFVTFEVGACNGKVYALYKHDSHELYYVE